MSPANVTQAGADTVIDLGAAAGGAASTNVLTLADFAIGNLDAGDFLIYPYTEWNLSGIDPNGGESLSSGRGGNDRLEGREGEDLIIGDARPHSRAPRRGGNDR